MTAVVPVFYGHITSDPRGGIGYASYLLAKRLYDLGLLRCMVCTSCDPDLDLPQEVVLSLTGDRRYRTLFHGIARFYRRLHLPEPRYKREAIFEHFILRHLTFSPGDLLFCSRPIFPRTIARAGAAGLQVWIQTSIPHPLIVAALVHNEEIRFGLSGNSPYTNRQRVRRLTGALQAADRIVTMSRKTGRFSHETYRGLLPADRLLSLDHFFITDPRPYRSAPAARRSRAAAAPLTFLHVSHINLVKGIPYLLDAWRALKRSTHKPCRLLLVGRIDRDIRHIIGKHYADLPDVTYGGFVSDLAATYIEGDVFVSPSVADNGPATIVEAMASGLPVVTSRNCGYASLIRDGVNGFTYDYNDVLQLTEILVWFLNHRDEARAMGEEALRVTADMTPRRYADELVTMIRRSL